MQIYFTDYFLGYEFRNYGSDVLAYTEMEQEDRPDPMAKVFPKVKNQLCCLTGVESKGHEQFFYPCGTSVFV